jgi:hypothetical protein
MSARIRRMQFRVSLGYLRQCFLRSDPSFVVGARSFRLFGTVSECTRIDQAQTWRCHQDLICLRCRTSSTYVAAFGCSRSLLRRVVIGRRNSHPTYHLLRPHHQLVSHCLLTRSRVCPRLTCFAGSCHIPRTSCPVSATETASFAYKCAISASQSEGTRRWGAPRSVPCSPCTARERAVKAGRQLRHSPVSTYL